MVLPEEEEVFKWKEEFEGVIDPMELYRICKEFLEDALKYDVYEEEYKVISENSKKKHSWRWKVEKEYDEFTSSASMFEVEVEYEEREAVLPTGERVKVKKGKGTATFKGVLKKDLDKLGKSGPAYLFRKVFENVFYGGTYKKWKNTLKEDSLKLREKIREYVGGIV